ncbi:proteasome-domain-containing protein [Cystobasidium minutum MCA 4210]|uniref:proteasome-domain-containing protein n=1 Tax=Cystobasidium minutum MCA 4210 TaxID=1397322 RepID=UPI0034CD1C20|eukprot:jgi/Rhomi1/169606/fgenesh1_kg.3_\
MDRIDWNALKKGEISMGTTLSATVFRDSNGKMGVIAAADSRTSSGSYVANRVTDKLTHLDDRIYCCRSGSAADTQAVADIVTYQLQLYRQVHNESPPVHIAAKMFQQVCYANKDALSAGIIVAGYDDENGASVYNIPLGGGLFKAPWAIGGSGSTYVYGYCDANWKPDMTKEEAIDFLRNAVGLAIARDGSSGGTIRMVVITESGTERIFVPGNELKANGGLWGSKPVIAAEVAHQRETGIAA